MNLSPAWHVSILIPARNEEALLPRCLRSVENARLALPESITSDLVIVSDSSYDRTMQIATEAFNSSPLPGIILSSESGCVGTARALAAETALRRRTTPLSRCWLANTDADCVVPSDWLTRQIAIANRGFTAVAGIVDVDSFAEHTAAVPDRFRRSYLIHEDGTHPHVHAANLGIRADIYRTAGGWQNLATAEDHDLWHRLSAADHPRLSDASLCVRTSGRRIGRAPLGFAAALAGHNENLEQDGAAA